MIEEAILGDYVSFEYGKLPPKNNSRNAKYPIFTGYRITGYSDMYLYEQPEIIVVARGVGGTGDVKISPPFSYITNLSIVLKPIKPLNKYYLKTYLSLANLRQLDSGAAQSMITIESLRKVPIKLPLLEVQNRIAAILENYDNLIENNRKRIALLEESARLLYQEWFVKFRFPKLISETDKLSSVNWNKTTIGQCSSFLNRGITPKYDENGLSIVINQKCIRNGLLDLSLARRQSKEINPERLVQKGDILINSTGTGTLGRVAVVRSNIPNCTVDTHVTIVRPLDSSKFAYLALTLLELENHLSSMGVGATNQQELNRADIAAIPIFELPENIQIQFDEIIKPIFEQTEVLQEINKKLQKARDELLPKLISGQIKV